MKKLLSLVLLFSLIQCFSSNASASETIESDQEIVSYLESSRDLLNNLGESNYQFKETIGCETLLLKSDPIRPYRGHVNYFRCPDLTISFPQPESTGFSGWNGKCGQTAISNITGMLCNRFIHPETINSYAYDYTPGNRPGTNLKALRKIFTEEGHHRSGKANTCPKGTWREFSAPNENKYLEDLKSSLWKGPGRVKRKRKNGTIIKITPVLVLISSGLKSHHWVTLVDFRLNRNDRFGCDAIMNTWAYQKVMTCSDLVKFGNTKIYGRRFLALEQ